MDIKDYAKSGIEEILVTSSIDGSREPSLLWRCEEQPAPLLVGLHTWSADRHNQVDTFFPLARKHSWHLLLPEFRGPNLNTNPRATSACASTLAMQDVIDAIEMVCSMVRVDQSRIFLIGGSGGGHMALMLAGYKPALWCSVASFCGITDLKAWHSENPSYTPHIEACCGGKPDEKSDEYAKRSPVSYAIEIAKCREVYIYHGKFDRSVPFTHGLNLFNKICSINPQAHVFLEIFDGGHDMIIEKAESQFLKAGKTAKVISG